MEEHLVVDFMHITAYMIVLSTKHKINTYNLLLINLVESTTKHYAYHIIQSQLLYPFENFKNSFEL